MTRIYINLRVIPDLIRDPVKIKQMLRQVQHDNRYNIAMTTLHLRIITPQKIALEEDVSAVTAPSAQGEITILPHHVNLFTLLKEGIIRIKPSAKTTEDKEKYLAIGGGYLETDGEEVNVLVSRAYGQNEIDSEKTQKAIEEAKNIIAQARDESQRKQAISLLRRSVIDMKLLKRRKHVQSSV